MKSKVVAKLHFARMHLLGLRSSPKQIILSNATNCTVSFDKISDPGIIVLSEPNQLIYKGRKKIKRLIISSFSVCFVQVITSFREQFGINMHEKWLMYCTRKNVIT